MTALLGAALGAGLLLVLSPWLWPRSSRRPSTGRLARRLVDRLTAAGLQGIPLRAFAAVSLLFAIAGWGLLFGVTGIPVVAAVAGAVAGALPSGIVSWRANARRRAARGAWPDLLDHLVASLRAGVPLPEALASLATAGPASLRVAFARFGRDYEATANFSLCLDGVKEQLADPVADRIVETLRLARQVGGTELLAVLRALASGLREEAATRAELEARQSWVTNAAKLGVAAPWLVLLLLCTRPEAAAAYASPGGVTLILGGVGVSIVAYRVMLAIGRLPEEGRWFR
ncbi:MAG: type secretion system protein [Naasia sp.]|jgi:tight adherence protein B|uniref:type II secretion system F family protein n=1 Tax=Naasia sp. TaxID=2546198 RepID=UPI002615CF22|nr:type II secretion system F family protein [Naasia sp.]MCU1571531.1 type secretion system protein [Naasia sp.]